MTPMGYLNHEGLAHLWGKVRAALAAKQDRLTGTAGQVVGFDADGNAVVQGTQSLVGPKGDKGDPGLFYATCSTAASTTAKAAALTGFALTAGAVVAVKFTNSNTASSPTLNVNGTGAKSIKKYGTTAPNTYMWAAGAVVEFVYDGTYWIMLGGTTATTTYYGVTKLNSSTSSTSTTEAATPSAVKAAYDAARSKVPTTRTVNGKALSADISLSAAEIMVSDGMQTALGFPALQNLVKNGDFEDYDAGVEMPNQWIVNNVSMSDSYSDLSTRVRFLNVPESYITQVIGPTDSGHLYYFRMTAWCGDAMAEATINVYFGQANFSKTYALSNYGGGTLVSFSGQGGTPESLYITCSGYDYTDVDNVMLVDLTEAFGAGNEPTKEWCDENITYSVTECTCKVSVDEVLRKIAQVLNP